MEFGLSEAQRLLVDSVAGWLRDRVPLARVRRFGDADEGRAADLVSGLAELGVAGVLIPEAFGGVGLAALDACLVAETLGYRVAPVPFTAHAVMVPTALLLAGSPAQQEAWLPRIAVGSMVFGAALAERSGARGDAGVICVNGRLSGRALHVLDFAADAWLVADRAGGLHLVAADAPGVVARRFLAVALLLAGRSRTEAALQCGMQRQTLRDWVHRYNAEGVAGLASRVGPEPALRLDDEQMEALRALVVAGPNPAQMGLCAGAVSICANRSSAAFR